MEKLPTVIAIQQLSTQPLEYIHKDTSCLLSIDIDRLIADGQYVHAQESLRISAPLADGRHLTLFVRLSGDMTKAISSYTADIDFVESYQEIRTNEISWPEAAQGLKKLLIDEATAAELAKLPDASTIENMRTAAVQAGKKPKEI